MPTEPAGWQYCHPAPLRVLFVSQNIPMANAKGCNGSKGSIGEFDKRSQPSGRRSPWACSEIIGKKGATIDKTARDFDCSATAGRGVVDVAPWCTGFFVSGAAFYVGRRAA